VGQRPYASKIGFSPLAPAEKVLVKIPLLLTPYPVPLTPKGLGVRGKGKAEGYFLVKTKKQRPLPKAMHL
jgi:hypothetical protein